jgi:hypothetical protein
VTQVTSSQQIREWLDHPCSRNLKHLIQLRRDRLVGEILSGQQVNPVRQGQAVALQWVSQILDLHPDQLADRLQSKTDL